MSVETTTNTSPIGYWTGAFKKYATFSGRARRAEYWWYTLINVIIAVVLSVVGYLVGGSDGMSPIFSILAGLYFLATLVPSLAVGVRRLHDAGFSGWFLLLSFVPLGSFVVLVFMLMPGKPANQYGPDPR